MCCYVKVEQRNVQHTEKERERETERKKKMNKSKTSVNMVE